jgi:flagellar biosynthesis protein FliP
MFDENTSAGAYQNGYQPMSSTEIHRIKQLKHTTQVSIQSVFNHTSRSTIYNTIEISKKNSYSSDENPQVGHAPAPSF